MWIEDVIFMPPTSPHPLKEVMILSVQVFEGSASDILNKADFQQLTVQHLLNFWAFWATKP